MKILILIYYDIKFRYQCLGKYNTDMQCATSISVCCQSSTSWYY